MAGAVGIVFGLCVLSFTLGAALMYVVLRRREDAAVPEESAAPASRDWVAKSAVEAVADDYGSRPIHRNPVVGLPQLEPALASLAEPVGEAEVEVEPVADVDALAESEPVAEIAEPVDERAPVDEPDSVGAARYDQDGDFDPPVGDLEAPESTVAPSTDSPEAVDEPVEEPAPQPQPEPEVEPAQEKAPEAIATTELPPPASPQPAEQTTWVEREDFRQRYLRTFEEVRRKAGSN
ncbi:hypothetical protein ACIA8G_14580 [Lentzea sp. NPDC051213]|uniref:hypothetical protein n=1 Tax=Lentzea sp. NPDC051213 TaxID=3364126 RepID=UPI003794FCE7